MISIADIQRVLGEDLTGYKRDVLEFNHKQLAKGTLDYIEMAQRFAHERFRNLQHLVDVGAHVTVLLTQAQRAGRKTVRIDDILAEAEKNLAESTAKLSESASSAPRVLDADPVEVQAALDALPLGSVVRTEALGEFDAVLVKREAITSNEHVWYVTGIQAPETSASVAKYCAPLTVIA